MARTTCRSRPERRRFSSGTHKRKGDRKSTRLNSSHDQMSYAVFCLKKKKAVIAALFGELPPPEIALPQAVPHDAAREPVRPACDVRGSQPLGYVDVVQDRWVACVRF